MPSSLAAAERPLLEALLDSWDRNNAILLNLLRALPSGGLGARAMAGSPTVGQMYSHLCYIRFVHVEEDAPEFAQPVPKGEWQDERDAEKIARLLAESAAIVRTAIRARLENGRPTERHFDHPVLFLQFLIWHEGYHHGQMKLALKLAGTPATDEQVGIGTWGVWMDKTAGAQSG